MYFNLFIENKYYLLNVFVSAMLCRPNYYIATTFLGTCCSQTLRKC